MTQSFQLLPSGDVQNDGWTLVGSSVTEVWEVVGTLHDDCYIRTPLYRGSATVSFPVDVDNLPEGAIIDSVTVVVRMRTVAGSGPRCVTVNVLSSENMSRYTSRTLYATSAFNTFEVGTYTKDPLGQAWDIHRLNKLRLRVYSLNNLFDSINISQLYVQVNYHLRPKVQVTAPSGTSVSPSPVVQWAYTHEEGEPQAKADILVFTAQQVSAATTFNPDTEPPVYSTTLVGSASTLQIPTTLNDDGYRVYVRVWSDYGAKSTWGHKDFVISAPSPGVPGDDNAGISGTPGVGVPTAIPDNYTSSAQLRMRDASNLLSVQQADFEVPSDPLEYTATNATLARDTTRAFGNGLASMSITTTADGDSVVESTMIEVYPSIALTLRVQGRASTDARTCELFCTFYDENYDVISVSTDVAITDSTSTWKEAVGNITTPADTAYLKLGYRVVGASAGEVHYLDHCGVMYGTNSAWTDGGHQSRNLLTSHMATGDDPVPASDAWEQANVATTLATASVSGSGSHGERCHRMTYVGTPAQIAFRSVGTVFTTPTAGVNYTLNKPPGTTDNDLLIAFVTTTEHGTIIPPAGWTAVNSASIDDGSTDIAMHVLKRTATASDPSSWSTGKLSASSARRTAVVVAYAGAAHADQQFIADNVRTDASGEIVHQTQTVYNSDPNAWYVAGFAASDDVTGGTFSANRVAPVGADAPPIQFVGAGAMWRDHSRNTSFKLYRPSGVLSGDLMIASIVFSGRISTVTPPTGWTLVRTSTEEFPNSSDGDAHSGDVTVAVFKRTAGSSEPTSWTGSHGQWGQPKVTRVVAYRNCADASEQFLGEGSGTAVNTSTVTTAEVTNTNSKAWRVCIFGATTPFVSSWSDGDVIERCDSSTSQNNFPDAVLQFSDSNGVVSTGTHKRTAKINSISNRFSNVPTGNFFTAVGWIGIIKPIAAPPAQPGDETQRADNRIGSSNPWASAAVYDSNGAVAAGNVSLYGQFSPGSGTAANSMASWIGIIRPASGSVAGFTSARTNRWIDISEMDSSILGLAGNRITVMSNFLGSTDGTPIIGVDFARANQAISSSAATGTVYNTTSWTKSWATFNVPEGTTRIRPVLSSTDRVVNDWVAFDRIGVMLGAPETGEVPAWRNGTARPEHSVWSKPVIQYTDDTGLGFESWANLSGQKLIPPAFRSDTGLLAYVDHTVIPLNLRKYRVQTLSYGLNGEIFSSGWGPESNEVSLEAVNWWLKDFNDLTRSLRMRVKYEDIQVATDNTSAVYHPLGEDFPVVVTEGYKADSLTISVFCDRQEEASLYRLLRSNRTLLLQSDTDYAWWVRPVDVLNTTNLAVSQKRRTSDPIKVVTCRFVQVKPEE